MKINGVRYLDANNFDRLIITDKDGLNIKATSNISYPTNNSNKPLSKQLDRTDNDKTKFEIVDYFLRNNEIDCVQDNVYLPRYDGKFSMIGSNGRKLYLQTMITPTSVGLINNVLKKYYFDRSRIMYSLDDIDTYKIYLSNKTSYRIYELNGKKVLELNLKSREGQYSLEKKEREFITEFIRYKLSLCENEAVIRKLKRYNSILENYIESEYYLLCDDLRICIKSNRLLPLLDMLVFEHNEQIQEYNKKQLKMEGI